MAEKKKIAVCPVCDNELVDLRELGAWIWCPHCEVAIDSDAVVWRET